MLVRLFLAAIFVPLRTNSELSMVAADLKRDADRDRGTIKVPIPAGMNEPLRLLRLWPSMGQTRREICSTHRCPCGALARVGIRRLRSKPSEKIPP